MQGCRERGGVYIQRIEKSTALDQVWHGFMAPEPLGFGGLGQRKCASQQGPLPLPPPSHIAPIKGAAVLIRRCAIDRSRVSARSSRLLLKKAATQRGNGGDGPASPARRPSGDDCRGRGHWSHAGLNTTK